MQIDVTQVTQRNNFTTHGAQFGEIVNESENVVGARVLDGFKNLAGLSAHAFGLGQRVLAHPLDFIELTDGCLRGRVDFGQCALQVVCFRAPRPKISIADAAGELYQIDVKVSVAVVLGEQGEHSLALGHAADDLCVADFIQKRVLLRLGSKTLFKVWRLPHLQGVVLLRLFLTTEVDQLTVGEQAVAIADDRR